MIGYLTEDLAREPAAARERVAAWIVACALVFGVLIDAMVANNMLPVVPAIEPAVGTLTLCAWVVCAWSLYAQYRVTGHAPFAVLTAGFTLMAVSQVVVLATSRMAFGTAIWPLDVTQAAPWAYVAGLALLELIIVAYVFAERAERRARDAAARAARPVLYAAAAIGLALLAFLPLEAHALPPLVDRTFGYTELFTALSTILAAGAALTALLVYAVLGSGSRVPLWLFVLLCAAAGELITSQLFGQAIFSRGWYTGRIYSLIEPSLFLLVAFGQTETILRRAQVTGERGHALSQMLAASAQATVDFDALLGRAAAKFGFDVVYLGRLAGRELIAESVIGKGDCMPVGTRVPLERTLCRQVIACGSLVVIEDVPTSEPSESVEAQSGCTTYCGIPIYVEDELYGVVGFYNTSPRAERLSALDGDFMNLVGVLIGNALAGGRQRKRLDELAFYDALTGLPNRVLLMDRITTALSQAERYGGRLALHFLDLDGFKPINDLHGHAVGDVVLTEVGKRLTAAVRQSDTVARYGGDEFVVLQPVVNNVSGVHEMTRRLRAAFGEPFTIGDASFEVGATVGVSIYPEAGLDAGTLIAEADAALYRAKDARRAALKQAQRPK